MRNQSPSGALVSPREIPAGSKENGSLAEVRGIDQGGAPQCATQERTLYAGTTTFAAVYRAAADARRCRGCAGVGGAE